MNEVNVKLKNVNYKRIYCEIVLLVCCFFIFNMKEAVYESLKHQFELGQHILLYCLCWYYSSHWINLAQKCDNTFLRCITSVWLIFIYLFEFVPPRRKPLIPLQTIMHNVLCGKLVLVIASRFLTIIPWLIKKHFTLS